MPAPLLITFDIFGTVLDWKAGLEAACAARGRPLQPGEFDQIIDLQGELEQGEFDLYTSIVIKSLVGVLKFDATQAAEVADGIGRWPLFEDSREGLRRLQAVTRCAATTNSDLHHAAQVQDSLGFPLSGWICAEEVKHYKPRRDLWDSASERMGVPVGPAWWHVSAYADYDLATAKELGLTTVLVERPHCRKGPADVTVPDLRALAAVVAKLR